MPEPEFSASVMCKNLKSYYFFKLFNTEAENSGSVTGSWLQGITVHISRNYNFFYKFKKLVYHNVEITDSPMGEIQNDHSDYQSISNDQQSFEESATCTKNLSYQLLEVSYI